MPFLLKEYSHGGDGAGLLANPGNCSSAMRGLNGYRFYNDEAVKMLLFVGRAQALGMTLKEIKPLLNFALTGSAPLHSCEQLARESVTKVRRQDS